MSDTTTTANTESTATATDGGGDGITSAPPVDTSTATVTATESAPGIFADGSLNFRDGWFNDVKDSSFDETRSMAAQFKDLPSVFKSLKDTKAALSQRTEGMVKLPTANSTPEEIAAYHRATGVPESPEAYKIAPPAQLPAGVEFPAETLKSFAEFAHKAGISNQQANDLVAFQAQVAGAEMAMIQSQQQAQAQAAEKLLQSEWGANYERNNMLSKRAAETFGLGADHPALANPDIRKALARAAEVISEDKLASGDKVTGTLSPGSEAADILANPDNPLHKAYHDSSHPQHKQAWNTYMQKLEQQVKLEGKG